MAPINNDELLVSLVIPVLNDAAALGALLPALGLPTSGLTASPPDPVVQVTVVNGGEADDHGIAALRDRFPSVEWRHSIPGRGAQMNVGAERARGRWLVFLHADTRLEPGWIDLIRRVDEDPRIVGGSFRFALDSPARWARWIESGVWARVRLFNLPYGDQALFVRRAIFQEMGGYRALPLMEDVDFVRRLGRRGRLEHAGVRALTSARRWERDGWVGRTMENSLLLALFLMGWPPERLARRYNRGRQ